MCISEINIAWKRGLTPEYKTLGDRILYYLIKIGAENKEALMNRVCITKRDKQIFDVVILVLKAKLLIKTTVFTNGFHPNIPPWTMVYAEIKAVEWVKRISLDMKLLYRVKYGV